MIDIYAEVGGYRYLCDSVENWVDAETEAKEYKEILKDNGFVNNSVVITDKEIANNGHITKLI